MTESTLALWQETALKVRELQVRFDAFETENKISDNYFNEFDEELEEGRVSLEKLEKRVRELETDLPELITERVAILEDHLRKLKDKMQIIGEGDNKRLDLLEEKTAVLDAQNVELRTHLNLLVDAVNNLTRIWNEQVHEGEVVDDDDEQSTEDPPQLTLQQVYNMYQSQPRDEEGWEEMTNAIEVAEKYEASLPIRTNGLTQQEWDDLLQI